MYKLLHCPSQADFTNIIRLGGIKGCQVTLENVDVAHKIWGPSVVKAKGNTVRRNAKVQESNIVAVPRELIAAQIR